MSILRGIAATCLLVCSASISWGANTVVVDSKTVCAGAKGVTIGVKITNDREVRHVTVPLEIRSVPGGAFVTSVKMSWGDRMPLGRTHPLGENGFASQFYVRDCPCAKDQVQGYGKIASTDTLAHDVKGETVGLLFSRFRMMGENLKPGQDSTGSFILTVDVGDKAGKFEIDTTCICPSHTLMFVDIAPTPEGVFPTFTKGVITVEACAGKGK